MHLERISIKSESEEIKKKYPENYISDVLDEELCFIDDKRHNLR